MMIKFVTELSLTITHCGSARSKCDRLADSVVSHRGVQQADGGDDDKTASCDAACYSRGSLDSPGPLLSVVSGSHR